MEFAGNSIIRRTNKNRDINVLHDSSNIESGVGSGARQQHVPIVIDETDNYNLTMYNQPPSEVITVEEFQELGMKRMIVLRELEALKEKYASDPRKYLEQFIEVS
jgi:hypothetical protein